MTDVDGITHLPPVTGRVKTGVTQFGDDWPGVFIRGDNAMHWGMVLQNAVKDLNHVDPLTQVVLSGLADTLLACDVRKLEGGPHD